LKRDRRTTNPAVVGGTVGDPLKDTARPALTPLVNVMNFISLLESADAAAGK
jgi:Na+/H+-translocating membrane pyrophosphatase